MGRQSGGIRGNIRSSAWTQPSATPQLSYASDKEQFKAYRNTAKKAAKKQNNTRIEKGQSYTGRIFYGSNEKDAVFAHTYTQAEVDAATMLGGILPTLKGGEYEPVNTQRENYKEKMKKYGVRHFTAYNVKINGKKFILKCEVKKDKDKNRLCEYPYSLKERSEG